MSQRCRVAVAQFTSNDDVDANLAAAERTVADAADQGAKLVVLPEAFAYLGTETGKLSILEELPAGGPILRRCQELARRFEVELLLGGFWEKAPDPEKAFNTAVMLRADGSVGECYRKIHLFDVDLPDGTKLAESNRVEAGEQVVVADAPFGKLGLSICYDLRFPELYRRLVDKGAIALAAPSAFTMTTGKDHWEVLLRARAIEQQCYVFAAAQVGRHVRMDGTGRRESYGHAMIVDPWGTVLAQVGDGEGVAVATVDPAVVAKIRQGLPSLKHRKF